MDNAGFGVANSYGLDSFARLVSDTPLVRTSDDIRDSQGDSDEKILEEMLGGQTVQFGSVEEQQRVLSKRQSGIVVFQPDNEFVMKEAWLKNQVKKGNAVILLDPSCPTYVCIYTEKYPYAQYLKH